MKPRNYFFAVLVWLVISSQGMAARTWTDQTGKTVKAEFVRVFQGDAILSRGGRPVRIPLNNLSEADQQYIREKTGDKNGTRNESSGSLGADGGASRTGDRLYSMRTWQDSSGTPIRAKFVRVHQGKVILTQGSKELQLSFHDLSPQDQTYLRGQLEAEGQGQSLPPPPLYLMPDADLIPVVQAARIAPPDPFGIRQWTDLQNRRIAAQLIGLSGDDIILLQEGKTCMVPLLQLSTEDRKYVRAVMEDLGHENQLPELLRDPSLAGPSGDEDNSEEDAGGVNSRPHSFRIARPINEPRATTSRPSPSPEDEDEMYEDEMDDEMYEEEMYEDEMYEEEMYEEEMYEEEMEEEIMAFFCSECDQEVPEDAHDECPHCGCNWTHETQADGSVVETDSGSDFNILRTRGGRKLVVWGVILAFSFVIGVFKKMAGSSS